MAISNRELVVAGATLTATYKGQRFTCDVSAGEGDKLVYRLGDGRTFSSPSSAGSAAKGGKSCNGFEFWTVADKAEAPAEATKAVAKAVGKAVKAARQPKAKAPAATPAGGRKYVQVRKMQKQDGCPEGETKWFCSACMKGFCRPTGETPEACPEGHPREVEDDLASPAGDAAATKED